jgi:hypothetical protein
MRARLAFVAFSLLGLVFLSQCGGSPKRPEAPPEPAPSARPVEEAAAGAGGAAPEEPEEKPRRPDPKLVQKALDRTGAEAPDGAKAHGLRFEVVEVGPGTSWALTVVNRGSEDAHVVFDPRLLTLEIDAPPDPAAKRKKAPKPRVCRLPPTLRPEKDDKDYVIALAPGHGIVEAFDPQLYCLPEGGVSPLVSGATVRASFGFPLKTKTVWKRGKREEEVLPQVAPFVAALYPESAHRHRRRDHEHAGEPEHADGDRHERGHRHRDGHGHKRGHSGGHKDERGPGSVVAEDAGAAAAADAAAPLDDKQRGDERELTDAGEPSANVKLLTGTPFTLGADYAPPAKLKEETLVLELERGSDAFSESNVTVTLKLANHGKRPERVYFRRELVSFQVTGPDGSLICDPQPDTRAPDRQAFSLLNPGGSLTITSRLIELCPDDTFARPGMYVVEAAFDAFADGKDFGYEAFIGHLVADRGVVVRVQTGSLPFPGVRALEAVRVGSTPQP